MIHFKNRSLEITYCRTFKLFLWGHTQKCLEYTPGSAFSSCSWKAMGTIWISGDQIWVNYLKGKPSISYIITLVPTLIFLQWKKNSIELRWTDKTYIHLFMTCFYVNMEILLSLSLLTCNVGVIMVFFVTVP